MNRQEPKLAKMVPKSPSNLGILENILAYFPEGHRDGVQLGG